MENIRNLINDREENAEVIRQRIKLKCYSGDYKGALEDLNRADSIQPRDAFILSYRGATKRFLGDIKGALEDLNIADEVEPENAFTLKNRGATKGALGDYQGALEDFNRADEIEQNDAFTLQHRGIAKYMLDDYKGSLEDLNRAHEIQPKNPSILYNRAETKQMLDDDEGALEDFNRADELQPKNPSILYNRAVTRRMLDDYQGALEDFNRADEIQPNNAFTLQQRGITKMALKEWRGALEDLNRADKINPNEMITIQSRGEAKRMLGDLKGANEDCRRAYEIYYSNSTAEFHVLFSELKVIKTLGEGGFGEVSLAEWRGIKVALKKLKSKSNVGVDGMFLEAKTLMRLHYKFIVTLMAITTDPTTNSTVLIMEYMKHGSLEDLLFKQNVKLSRTEVIRLALDIALGVNYLHSHKPKVLHRDLKSANVLLYRNKTRAKIADFGTAKFLYTNFQANTVINNFIAVPPEMLAEENYDEKVDVFSFGAILYEMLTNKHLPILEETPRIERIRENIGDEYLQLKDLVLDCCASDPTKRPHMRDIIQLLKKMKSESK